MKINNHLKRIEETINSTRKSVSNDSKGVLLGKLDLLELEFIKLVEKIKKCK